jgi:DnaJ family protein A protein 5
VRRRRPPAAAASSLLSTRRSPSRLHTRADKNQHRLEEAEARFKEIQNAWEVLGDAHERAFYDAHRASILRSGERHQAGDGGPGGQRPADEPDLYAYFSASCFAGFGEGPRSFYSVYGALFETLGKQEAAARAARAARAAGAARAASAPPPLAGPAFGGAGAPWEAVATFYAEWAGFASAKDFAWADEYNPASAPDRRVRRLMEADNAKARKAARREYNEGVRELVAFVRKRDKRVAARAVEEARRRQEREAADAARCAGFCGAQRGWEGVCGSWVRCGLQKRVFRKFGRGMDGRIRPRGGGLHVSSGRGLMGGLHVSST